MTSRKQNKLGPCVPTWFGVSRMLSDCEVVIRREDSSFRLSNQTVVLGRYGLLLVAPLVLREESQVQMRVTSDGRRLDVALLSECDPTFRPEQGNFCFLEWQRPTENRAEKQTNGRRQ